MQRIGVQRRLSAFLTALLLASLLASFVPAGSVPEDAQAVGPPVYACANLYTGALRYAPSGTCSPNETLVNLNGEPSITVCASLYTGMLRYPFGGSCTPSERSLLLPGENATNLCANRSTGRLRYQPNGTCPAGEGLVLIPQANDPPVAQDDAFTIDEDTVLNGNVLADNGNGPDSDIEGDPLSVNPTPVSGPSNGLLVLNSDGTFTYTPNPDFFGVDTFTYQLLDGEGGTDTGLVTITVSPINDDPIANPQAVSTDEDVAVVITLTGTDVDGDTLTFAIDTPPTNGVLGPITPVDDTSAQATYTPGLNFFGGDSFTFTVSDASVTSPAATVTITVNSVNDPPVAQDDAFTTDEDVAVGGNVLADNGSGADSDPEGDALTVTTAPVTAPTNGNLILNADGTFTYTPDLNFNGSDSFEYEVCDPEPLCDTAAVTITVNAVNDAPLAQDDAFTTDEDVPVNGNVLDDNGNGPDSDVDGDPLTVNTTPLTPPANGGVVLEADGDFTYTPNADFFGVDSFVYEVCDPAPLCDTATVTITVDPVNDAPVAQDDAFTTDEDVALNGNVLDDNGAGIDDDVDGDALTVTTTPVSGPSNGGLTLNADGTFTYTPDLNFNGVDSFTYQVCDPAPLCDTATVTITVDPVNDPPLAQDDAFTTDEDVALNGNVLADNGSGPDSDVDGNPLTVDTFPVSGPSNGLLVLEADGDFTYTPNLNFNGTDTFTYLVCDPAPLCDTAIVTITVNPLNDAPLAQDDAFTTDEDTPLNGNVLDDNGAGIDDDVDGDPLTVNTTPVSGPADGNLTLNADGTFSYTPDLNFNGSDSFTYEVCDPAPLCDTATVTITVTAVDDPPVAVNDIATVLEDSGPNAIDVLANDTDVDAGPKTVDTVQNPSANGGEVLITGGGTGVSYEPAPDYCNDPPASTLDTFTYTLNGGDTATVTVTVTCVNDPPAIDLDLNDSGGTGGSDFALNYTENAGGVLIVDPADATITDVDSTTLVSLTVTITNLQDAGLEFLAANADAFPGISDTYNPLTGVLTISSVTPQPLADYQAVLRTVTYEHSGEDPTGAPARLVTFVANDGTDDSNTATSTVTVIPVDDPPTAVDDSATVLEDSGATTIDVMANDTDPDDTSANVIQLTSDPANGTVQITNMGADLTYEPDLDYCNSGPPAEPADTFTYTLQPGGSTATVSVTVTCVNDPPVAGADSFDFIGNTELRVDLAAAGTPTVLDTTGSGDGALDNDSEPEGDSFAVTSLTVGSCTDSTGPTFTCSDPAVGTVTMNADGTFSFIPAPGDTDASESFSYTITDDGLPAPESAVGTVTLTRFERVWYADPNAPGGGDGTSALPFNTLTPLSGAGGAGDADLSGDYLFVHDGTLAMTTPLPLEGSQHLLGQGVGLSIAVNLNGNGSPTDLVAAGTQPQLTNATGDAITIGAAIPTEIRGLSLAGGTGNAIDLTSTTPLSGSSSLLIESNEFRGAGAEGIDVNLNAGTTGTLDLTIQSNTWAAGTHTGSAVDVSRLAGTLNLAFNSNTGLRSSGSAVVIDGGAAASTTITSFANNSVHGDTAATGVQVSLATFDATPGGAVQQVNAGTLPIGTSGNPVGGPGLRLIAVLGNLLFSDLDIFATSSGLTLTGTAGSTFFNVTPASSGGSSTIVAGAGPAVTVTGAALDLRLADLDSTTASDGVNLNTVSGQFSAPAGSTITKASGGGTGFVVASSSATVTYGGTVDVSSGAGVSLTNNTGTMSFTGQLTLTTGTNAAFTATGGGTVTATATNNTLTTTTATALNVNGTTIGAGGLVFQSISANGAANGIVLNTTGTTAGLTVTGDGSAGSGGTIQNITNRGASFISAADIELNWMTFTNAATTNGADPTNANSTCGDVSAGSNLGCNAPVHLASITGIGGGPGAILNQLTINGSAQVGLNLANVTGLTLTNVTISGIGNQVREHSIKGFNVAGTVTFTNVNASGTGNDDNVSIYNNAGTATMTVTGSTFNTSGAGVPSVGGDGFVFSAAGSAVLDLDVTTSNFNSNFASGFIAGFIDPGTMSTANADIDIASSSFNNNNAGIQVVNAGSADVTFDVTGITNLSGNPAAGIAIDQADNSTASASTVGTLSGNTITMPNSGSGNGIFFSARGSGTATILVTGNTITSTTQYGIHLHKKEGAGGTLNATVTNNNVTTNDTFGDLLFPIDGIRVEAGAASGDGGTVCANISANTVDGAGEEADAPGFDLKLRHRFGATFQVPGIAGTTATDAINRLNALNPAADTIDATTTTAFSNSPGGAACTTP